MVIKHIFLYLFFISITACSIQKPAQSSYIPADQALYETIARQDSLFFTAFNARNLEGMKQFLDTSLELFQDNTGKRNYTQAVAAFGGLFEKDYVLTRSLVTGSMEVYPIKDFGAIQSGRHTFCHMENGKPDCGTFKFMHIWSRQSGQWKLVKIITYDH